MSQTSAFVLGLIAAPCVVALTIGLWAVLTALTSVLVNFLTLLHIDSTKPRREVLGSMMYAADRAWMLRTKRAAIVLMWDRSRVDNPVAKRAERALMNLSDAGE